MDFSVKCHHCDKVVKRFLVSDRDKVPVCEEHLPGEVANKGETQCREVDIEAWFWVKSISSLELYERMRESSFRALSILETIGQIAKAEANRAKAALKSVCKQTIVRLNRQFRLNFLQIPHFNRDFESKNRQIKRLANDLKAYCGMLSIYEENLQNHLSALSKQLGEHIKQKKSKLLDVCFLLLRENKALSVLTPLIIDSVSLASKPELIQEMIKETVYKRLLSLLQKCSDIGDLWESVENIPKNAANSPDSAKYSLFSAIFTMSAEIAVTCKENPSFDRIFFYDRKDKKRITAKEAILEKIERLEDDYICNFAEFVREVGFDAEETPLLAEKLIEKQGKNLTRMIESENSLDFNLFFASYQSIAKIPRFSPRKTPNFSEKLVVLGEKLMKMGRIEDSERVYLEGLTALEEIGYDSEVVWSGWLSLVEIYTHTNRFPDIERSYIKALHHIPKNDPRYPTILSSLGLFYFHQNKWLEAETVLSQSNQVKSDPNTAVFLSVVRSNQYISKGKYPLAEKALLEALQILFQSDSCTEDVAIIFIKLGEMYIQCGKWEHAKDVLTNSRHILTYLGVCEQIEIQISMKIAGICKKLGLFEEAEREYQAIWTLSRDIKAEELFAIAKRLISVCLRAGKMEMARETLKNTIEQSELGGNHAKKVMILAKKIPKWHKISPESVTDSIDPACQVLFRLIESFAASKDTKRTQIYLAKAEELARLEDSIGLLGTCSLKKGQLCIDAHNFGQAEQSVQSAEASFSMLRDVQSLQEVRRLLSGFSRFRSFLDK